MQTTETHYACRKNGNVAYQVVGDGPLVRSGPSRSAQMTLPFAATFGRFFD